VSHKEGRGRGRTIPRGVGSAVVGDTVPAKQHTGRRGGGMSSVGLNLGGKATRVQVVKRGRG